MEKVLLLILLSLALASAMRGVANLPHGTRIVHKKTGQAGRSYYAGVFTGRCFSNGVYYSSQKSLVYCSNGKPSRQACPFGTQNSAATGYIFGHYYGYDDFCNVNLVNAKFVKSYQP